MKVEIISRVVYFYTAQIDVTSGSPDQKSKQLKKSLSESLSCFYPFAGRIKNNITIECNDDGAPYVEAKLNGLLSTFLEQPNNPGAIEQFFPAAIQSPDAGTWPILQVQATFFDCGGLAVGVCTSHKLFDARTMSVFIKSWAETLKGSGQTVVPVLDAASYFPPGRHRSFRPPPQELNKAGDQSVTKLFVFDKQTIVDLKAKTAGDRVKQPSRVEVVTALIWKCVMAGSRSIRVGVPKKTFFMTQAVDIRKRAEPPMPEHLIGNFVIPALTKYDDHELELSDMVAELREGIRRQFDENKAKILGGEDALQVILEDAKQLLELFRRDDADSLMVTSLCAFKLYEIADFGWGKPTWVNILPVANGLSKLVTLMDTREGGVEAWVTLGKNDMDLFERDPLLLEFATKNRLAI
ncbi:Transferase [Parasponia andersonii]|uniref:Transferase n=1 Tax=Parasponia andersonii TaxID=3476 RepID=A0A2P5CUX1_PARAD|nr:Transferase [Parasponia andersonii]